MPKSPALISLIEKEKLDLQQRKSLGEETTESLREPIRFKKLPAGLSLPEPDLADALGINRTPLREVMRVLAIEGRIKYTATRRPHVANPSSEELAQNLTIIGILNALGELACPNARYIDLSHNIALNDHMKQKTDRDEPLEFFRTDMKCHNAIVAASGNTPPVETLRQCNTRLWRTRFVLSLMRTSRNDTLQQHQDIGNAPVNRDTNATFAAVRSHLEVAIKHVA